MECPAQGNAEYFIGAISYILYPIKLFSSPFLRRLINLRNQKPCHRPQEKTKDPKHAQTDIGTDQYQHRMNG